MPTLRRQLLIGRIKEEKGREPLYKAMMAVGYSENYARASTKLTKSKTFQELLEEELPDAMLISALREDIESKKGNRHKELDLAFKVKGKLNTEQPPAGSTYNTFIQNGVDLNAPEAKDLAANTLAILMAQTKRKVGE